MAKFEAIGKGPLPKDALEPKNRDYEGKAKNLAQLLFPEPVWIVGMGLLWFVLLPGTLAIASRDLFSGLLTGSLMIFAITMGVLLWDTYTAKWRTMAWCMLISIILSILVMNFLQPFNGVALFVVIPTGLFALARINMNLRKLLIRVRN